MVTMFVLDKKILFIQFVVIFNFSGSLVIDVNWKLKINFCTGVILVYIIMKITLTEVVSL